MHQVLAPNVMREITPLSAGDCFTITSRERTEFDFPLHYHDEYELTLLLNAKGAKRVIGNSIGVVDDAELVFIGPNLYHAWFTHQCKSESFTEITIQFHQDLFDEHFLNRNQFCLIRNMFNNAQLGILFPKDTVNNIVERILNLKQKTQFAAVLELLSILHTLSLSANTQLLSDIGFSDEKLPYKSRRIEKVFEFLFNNYERAITLTEVAKIANMPATSFSRFFKKRTGKTFVESLNEIRLGHASRMLADTDFNITTIAYRCGFNNISNFNRIFKLKKLCVPKVFRETYNSGKKVYI
ncbi:MAG: AraC family transcriptional regulator [Bacteroidota bacterium]|nr:AraC family transcriptional regulator [Bacteroidota bacterium]